MTLVKICGVTRLEDALEAAALGASAIGLVFWPRSPRRVAPSAARAIVDALPPLVTPVGVFVDQPIADVERIAAEARLGAVQLHGRETPEYCREMRRPVIKAFAVDEQFDEGALSSYPDGVTMLLDARDDARKGGTGRPIDWSVAARVAARRRVMLAGGLRADNVAEAIARVRPFGVDVSSGVERAPGVKDRDKLEALFEAVRAADARLAGRGFTPDRRGADVMGRPPGTPGPSFGRRDPDARGYFGEFGGRFVPETLVAPIEELERAYYAARKDAEFCATLASLLTSYAGRPTPLYQAVRLTEAFGGAQIYLKREDLAHTGAHKINNAIGQALVAARMGKRRVVAETGAGQHGVATATACALLGLECCVYMGSEDMARQAPNVVRMRLLGAEVRAVDAGSRTLKDAINEAMRDWVTNVTDTYYLLGSVLGPHPYPLMVREFQSVIGREARAQFLDRTGALPRAVIACVGGGSNALGIFDAFLDDDGVRLIGVEAGGDGIRTGRHAARFAAGAAGVLQGTRSYVLQDEAGNIEPTHSISAGLDYAAVGPEHAWLRQRGRAEYAWASDEDALAAFHTLAKLEGLLPALESAHAVAYARTVARQVGRGETILVNLSGRGDKDVASVAGTLEGR